MLQKISVSNKCSSFELIYQNKPIEKSKMFSEGSCDTEDWRKFSFASQE